MYRTYRYCMEQEHVLNMKTPMDITTNRQCQSADFIVLVIFTPHVGEFEKSSLPLSRRTVHPITLTSEGTVIRFSKHQLTKQFPAQDRTLSSSSWLGFESTMCTFGQHTIEMILWSMVLTTRTVKYHQCPQTEHLQYILS